MKNSVLRYINFVFLLIAALISFSQPSLNRAKKQAERIGLAFMKMDYPYIIEHTYSRVIDLGGGYDNMLALITAEMESIQKEDSMVIKSIKVGKPYNLIQSDPEWYCIVPKSSVFDMPSLTMTSNTCLVGVSEDKGRTWTFVDCNGINESTFHAIFPYISPDQLAIPQTTYPELKFKKLVD